MASESSARGSHLLPSTLTRRPASSSSSSSSMMTRGRLRDIEDHAVRGVEEEEAPALEDPAVARWTRWRGAGICTPAGWRRTACLPLLDLSVEERPDKVRKYWCDRRALCWAGAFSF